jgi:hypothetical protein
MNLKIHVAYGFHVNCYHSYRGDTNDKNGFGSDIRIIRKIIAALDRLNAEGIPVKGTWDFENFFSLEQILPRHAPDIIEGVRRRVKENGDENIIMGYSNGALGAMEPEELEASIKLAVHNDRGSGLKDLFGKCEMIVRPQEVMFTPSQARTYNKLGVKALCLYYSCVPFDAFRTLVPPLPDELAFNPLTYRYGDESITVLPTYSNADVCDAGCLRAWVKELRAKQLSGGITTDLMLFVNMDADAVFWESLDLPLIGSRLANTDGITGLVREVADLDYVIFDTPGGYLRTHAPAGELRFTHDTADGNFTGYASWAEKPYNRKIFTAVERGRAAGTVFPDREAFLQRVQLLSTTHFGLATPVLNIQREQAADALAGAVEAAAAHVKGPLMLHDLTGGTLQCAQFACKAGTDVSRLRVDSPGLEAYTAVPMDEAGESVFLLLRYNENKKEYPLSASLRAKPEPRPCPGAILRSGGTEIRFSAGHGIERLLYRGKTLGGSGFLQSFLTYGGRKYPFEITRLTAAPLTGGSSVTLEGNIPLPGAEPGRFSYTFFTSDAAEGIFVLTDVVYPCTPERDAISTENSTLGRYTDNRWQEAAPFCLAPEIRGDVKVIKRNYEKDVSSFSVSSFAEADPKNRVLASFNNQLAAGLVGVTNGETGLFLAHNRRVLTSMASCPMRLNADGSVILNPFGTFYGPQRHHPNRSGDRIPRTYTLIAPQGKSLAPAYNGARERALMCLYPFAGDVPEEIPAALLAFADGAYATGKDALLSSAPCENVRLKPAAGTGNGVKMRSPLLTGIRGNYCKYIVRGVRAVAYIAGKQRKAK